MAAFLDLTGHTYGRLTVVSYVSRKPTKWSCRCSCGNTSVATTINLRSGNTTSCGCVHRERCSVASRTHGQTGSTEYRTWSHMIARCYNPRDTDFKDYGARGITVCDEWHYSFEAFYRDMGPKPSPRHSIERVDNNSGYFAKNCIWGSPIQQANNQRQTIRLTLNGETRSLCDWARKIGVPRDRLYGRICLGWPTERVLTEPVRAWAPGRRIHPR